MHWKSLLRGRASPSGAPATAPGERIYAVGDVHGRLDLFEALVAAIEADEAGREPASTTIVLLGDLIDRGPDSAGVVAAALALAARRTVRLIAGNHEEMLLDALEDCNVLRTFLRFGGSETLLSYRVDRAVLMAAEDLEAVRHELRRALPDEHVAFLAGAEPAVTCGDYLFVHAGVRPGVSLDRQDPREMRWIREPFLSHSGRHGAMVVHGHTISEQVEVQANRIGIDTGAYASGRLTALGLDGSERWLIATSEGDAGVITCTTTALA